MKGSFDKYAKDDKKKRGTAEVDDVFLLEIETWRKELAKNIALRNPDISTRSLNFAVQRIIDRIIFLRICEDRGVEGYGRLKTLKTGKDSYKQLCNFFQQADMKYNSGLFHFETEPDRNEPPDELTLSLNVDDKIIKYIIKNLYYPDSPYEFSVLPADTLGSIYERFLGKVIILDDKHRAKVEDKPEVKKAGGVYYTPTFVVDYIVKNTVGKLIQDSNPKKAAKIKILDPACGSGSFLIGAYQHILDWHLQYYIENLVPLLKQGKTTTSSEVKKHIPPPIKSKARKKKRRSQSEMIPVYQAGKDDWRLTTYERKRILLNNIFGVDIDSQAVEVTKLSLLLKVLEGETEQSLSHEYKLFHERALPDLSDNIKCGNALVSTDFYQIPTEEISEDEIEKMNPFEWEKEFPETFKGKNPGFDAVIGNPPYVRQETLGHVFKNYAQKHYEVYHGVADLYTYFIEKSHKLLKQKGLFGIICSNKFMKTGYGKPLRNFLAHKTTIREIIDFGELPVFKNASTFPSIILTSNEIVKTQKFFYAPIKTLDFQSLEEEKNGIGYDVSFDKSQGYIWTLSDDKNLDILRKIGKKGVKFGEIYKGKIFRGILTGLNKAFIINGDLMSKFIEECPKCIEIIKPFINGDDVRKYRLKKKKRYLIFTRRGIEIEDYPSIKKHLFEYKERLTPKPKDFKGEKWLGRKAGKYKWYEIQDTVDYYKEMEKPKIIWPEIAKESRFTFDEKGLYLNKTCFFTATNDLYLLGILNSKVVWFFLKNLCSVLGDANKSGRLLQQKIYIEKIPIIPKNNAPEQTVSKIESHVKTILDLNKKMDRMASSYEKKKYQRRIDALDTHINQMVYQLYDLTEEEIEIIEKSVKG